MSVFIGIDVSKATLDIVSLPDDHHQQVANTPDGHQQLLEWLQQYDGIAQIGLEASGRYGEAIADFLLRHGYDVSYLNPRQIHAFAQVHLHYNKTDKQDARLIAHYCQFFKPDLYQTHSSLRKCLQQRSRRLDALKAMQQQEINRLKSGGTDPFTRHQLEQHITALQQMIEQTQQSIDDLIHSDDQLSQQACLLSSIKGISVTSTHLILAEIDIDQFASPRQLAAYLGITPQHFQSGSSVKKQTSISKQGKARVRSGLYMPAIVAMQHNPPCRRFATRLRERHKPGKVIVIAVMRKLVHQIYGILKSGQPFDPHYDLSA